MQFYNINDADLDVLQARKREKKALWLNASKLGALLIIYHFLSNLMIDVYYYIVYAYKNHELTLSYPKIIEYLRGEDELIHSSVFSNVGNLFAVITTLAITLIIGRFLMKIDLGPLLKPKKNHVKQVVVWFPACMAINTIVSGAVAVFTMIMSEKGVNVPDADFTLSKPGALAVILQISYVVIIGPFVEEVVYRGIVLSLLKPYGKWLAVFTSALIFGLMHGNIPQAVTSFAGAVVYGLIAVKFDSIVPTILIHMLNNTFAGYTDYQSVYNMPMWIYYTAMIILAFAGVYVIMTRITELKITNDVPSLLRPGEKYKVVFTNIFMIIYMLILLSVFVISFYVANM